jgi:hypothetical protein
MTDEECGATCPEEPFDIEYTGRRGQYPQRKKQE